MQRVDAMQPAAHMADGQGPMVHTCEPANMIHLYFGFYFLHANNVLLHVHR